MVGREGKVTSDRADRTYRGGAVREFREIVDRGRSFDEQLYGLKALMSPSSLLLHSCAVCCPTDVIAVRQTMRTMANITAYSTAVGPSSSRRNFSSFVIGVFNSSESDAGEKRPHRLYMATV